MFKRIVNVLVFVLLTTAIFGQNEAELNEDAGKLFEKEQYVNATPLYLQLLSLNPTSADYNFRYGACLLSNSYKKQDAIRYLNFAVKDETSDPRVFYFHGKALHLNYQFEEAKESYKKYILKRDKKDKRYSVEREIEMCDNGKKLLSQFTDIIVSEKQEIDNQKFFRLYKNMQTIGGDILVSAEFQSKLDKKKGHVPIVHFPPQAKAIYYSSYGDNEATGKDIYIRRRLPNGGWGNPQLLPGSVNTIEDEDFPYMHPSGDFLYFSSKGHNSMGGYDVFFSRFNPNINAFGKPENVDFAISSPDDDLFYVVDSLHKNAYFASSRQSQNGKLHVYNVRVARVPIQEIIVMGDFLSEINPDNKSIFVNVTSNTNGAEVGKIMSNAKGKYSFVFPKGGKYNYEVTVDGSEDVYKFLVELPYLDEFRPLKQKAIHAMVNGKEVVRIVNLFDEKVEGAEALIADVIRKRSTLEVNVNNFDLKELDAQEERNKVLAEMGFSDMSMLEVSGQLEELSITEGLKRESVELIEANLSSEIVEKGDKISKLSEEIKALLERAIGIEEPAEKHKILLEAQRLETEKNQLALEIQSLNELKSAAIYTVGNDPKDTRRMEVLESQFNALLSADKEEEALALLSLNVDAINKTRNESPNQIVNDLVAQSLKLGAEVDELKSQQKELEKNKETAESELVLAKNNYANAKKKDIDRLKNEISDKEAEIEIIKDYDKEIKANITEKNIELGVVDNSIASMQKAMLNEDVTAIDKQKIEESIAGAQEVISKGNDGLVASELEVFESKYAEFDPNYNAKENPISNETENQAALYKEGYEERKAEVLADQSLTDLEKSKQLKVLSQEIYELVKARKIEVEAIIADDGSSEILNSEKSELDRLIKGLSADISLYENTLADLENSALSYSEEEVLRELSPNYEEEIEEIEKSDRTDLGKAEAVQALNTDLIDELKEELEKIEKVISKNPEDESLLNRQKVLNALVSQKDSELAEINQTINALNQTTSIVTAESVLNDVVPNYSMELVEIERNISLTQTESIKARIGIEDSTKKKLESRLKQVDKALKKEESNAKLLAEKGIIEELIAQKETSISKLNEELMLADTNRINTNTVDTTEIEATLKEELVVSYLQEKTELIEAGSNDFKSNKKLLELEIYQLEKLNENLAKVENDISKNEGDQALIVRKDVLEKLIAEQESTIYSSRDKLVSSVTALEIIQYQKDVDNDYPFDIATINGSDSRTKAKEAADREQALQDRIEAKIEENKEKMNRSYSVSFDIENMILERALQESAVRESEAKSNILTDTQGVLTQRKNEFISEIRLGALGEGNESISQTLDTKTELEAQDQILAFYETQLEQKIKSKQEELGTTNKADLVKSQINWLEEEKEMVAEKRRRVSVSIGELDQNAMLENSALSRGASFDPVLMNLEDDVDNIESLLKNENLSNSETKSLQNELAKAKIAVSERENQMLINELNDTGQDNGEIEKEIASLANPSIETEKGLAVNQVRQKVIEGIVQEAEKSSSEAERNYLLNKAADEQQKQNSELVALLVEEKINRIESKENVSLESKETLEQKRRRFTVQIGELTTEIIKVDKAMESAKKKEINVLATQKDALVAEKSLVESKLRVVEEKLLQESTTINVVSAEALDTELTFNEERHLASDDVYERYYEVASKALIIEKQIGNLEGEIKEEQKSINQLLNNSNIGETQIKTKIEAIKDKQIEVDRLNIELVQKNYEAKRALPENPEKAMKMQNLIMRGVKPLKAAALATALIQMPSTGLAINDESSSPYSTENPIPVGVESPSGLVYRVQIGAFSKPIPQDLFKEFNPVSGEKIGSTNVTRYMAGFFNNSDDVVEARTQIRSLGYSDAFVVAYCDGERIGFGEARRREAAGTCIPQGVNEMMLEVVAKTAEKMGIPLTNQVQDVPELTYSRAPGAVDAEPIEMKQGLFFTVQIGVFNRPVSSEEIYNLPDVLTIRLPNGQIRYASGMFNSAEEALPRQDQARKAGIVGPFITAYYQGERISIGNARRILYNEGEDVLQTNIEAKKAIEVIKTPLDVIRTDSVSLADPVEVISEITDEYIQIVTNRKFKDFPRDVLNRYNAEGNFFFDAKDSLVKSIIYANIDDLPRLYNFRNDIDTLYLPREYLDQDGTKILSIKLDSVIPGDFVDWLLRFNYRRQFVNTREGRELRIFGIEPNEVEKVQNDVRIFALEAVIIEETVYELELEENK